jgi:hypothetical protein
VGELLDKQKWYYFPMNRMRTITVTVSILVILVIGFILSVPHTHDVENKAAPATDTASTTPIVTLNDSYRKGVHTLSGSVELPNVCTSLDAEATLLGDASSTQTIALSLSAPADTGTCLQLPMQTTFSTTISAPSGLPISVTVNGIAASTTPK